MARIVKYVPQQIRPEQKFPVVVGFPGFVGKLEDGRTESILLALNQMGIAGCGVLYDGVDEESTEDRNKKITCDFHLENYIKDIEEALERISEDKRFDMQNFGMIATSISSTVIAYALANRRLNGFSPKAYTSIAPWVSYQTYSDEKTRKTLETAMMSNSITEIPLQPSDLDKERGIIRVIPARCAAELMKLDSLAELRREYKRGRMEVMTLLGNKDRISEPSAMMNYHRAFKADDSLLVVFDGEGHALNVDRIIPYTNKFFRRTLLNAS